MELGDIRARIRRLENHSANFQTEITLIRNGSDPMFCNEREPYVASLARAVTALEDARIALVTAAQRIEDGARGKACRKYSELWVSGESEMINIYVDGESHFIRSEKYWQKLHGPGASLERLEPLSTGVGDDG